MVYAVWTWYMLLEDGICCMDMEDVLLLEKNICAVYTVYVLYVQYMYCMYSTCTVYTAQIFFSNNKTFSMSIQHIPSSKSIYHVHTAYTMSQEHTYRVHRHQTRSGPKKTSDQVRTQKIEDFHFFPELKDDLWDVKYYHH